MDMPRSSIAASNLEYSDVISCKLEMNDQDKLQSHLK